MVKKKHFPLTKESRPEPTIEDYFEPVLKTPLATMKIGLHYDLKKDNMNSENQFKTLRLQLNRADQIMKEINNVLSHPHSSNPIEDVVNAFMTHHFEPEMPASFLPTFKEKLNENIELAKKTANDLDLSINPHRVNPNILIEERVSSEGKSLPPSSSSSHVKHHFDTHDYFEPLLVDSKGRVLQ